MRELILSELLRAHEPRIKFFVELSRLEFIFKMLSKYYYVVYFRELKQIFVLPGSWIQDIEIHAEKFLNYGMNTTQSFLCFYTTNPQAFENNKCPKTDWPVNFNLKISHSLESDSCFIGKLLKYSGNFSFR